MFNTFVYLFILDFTTNRKGEKSVYLRNDEKCDTTTLSWGRTSQEVLIGYKNGSVKIFDTILNKATVIKQSNTCRIVGVIPVEE